MSISHRQCAGKAKTLARRGPCSSNTTRHGLTGDAGGGTVRALPEPRARALSGIPLSDIATTLKAFGEPTRLRILRVVAAHELSVNELVDVLALPQSRVSRHLAVLRHAALVADRREGNRIYYRLAPERMAPLARHVWQVVARELEAAAFCADDLVRLREALAARSQRSRTYFDVVQDEWDRIRRHYIDDTVSHLRVSSLIAPDAVVADIGPGTGEALLLLAGMAARVIGVDQSQRMLDLCRRRADEAGLNNVELLCARAEEVPLPDGHCDVVFSSMLLHHLADPRAGLAEMVRLTRPGGKVIVSELVSHGYDWAREVMADVWLGFTEAQVRAWLESTGLTGITYWSGPAPPDDGAETSEGDMPKLHAFVATGEKPGDGSP